jgi:hypothetical protein
MVALIGVACRDRFVITLIRLDRVLRAGNLVPYAYFACLDSITRARLPIAVFILACMLGAALIQLIDHIPRQ